MNGVELALAIAIIGGIAYIIGAIRGPRTWDLFDITPSGQFADNSSESRTFIPGWPGTWLIRQIMIHVSRRASAPAYGTLWALIAMGVAPYVLIDLMKF